MTHHGIEATLMKLITDMEAEGYRIGMAPKDSGYYIKMPDRPTPDLCAMTRFAIAKRDDPKLEDAVEPFLRKYRPASIWSV